MDTKPTEEELKQALLQVENEGTSLQQQVETKTEPEIKEEVKVETDEEPLKTELEKVKSKKSAAEKARDSLYFNALEAKKLGIDPTKDERLKEIFGQSKVEQTSEETEEEKPLTRKDLMEILSQTQVAKSAEQLANEIQSEVERELTLHHLQNTIRSTGDPQEDFRNARALANSARNQKIMEEVARKPEVKSHSSASSQGSQQQADPQIKFTPEEQAFLATGKITKEEILMAREGKAIPR